MILLNYSIDRLNTGVLAIRKIGEPTGMILLNYSIDYWHETQPTAYSISWTQYVHLYTSP